MCVIGFVGLYTTQYRIWGVGGGGFGVCGVYGGGCVIYVFGSREDEKAAAEEVTPKLKPIDAYPLCRSLLKDYSSLVDRINLPGADMKRVATLYRKIFA